MGYQPSCLDPIIEDGKVFLKPKQKVDQLGRFFATKMTAKKKGIEQSIKQVRKDVAKLTKEGFLKLTREFLKMTCFNQFRVFPTSGL